MDLEHSIRTQNGLGKLKEKKIEMVRNKCNVIQSNQMQSSRNNQIHNYKLGNDWPGCSTAEKEQGARVHHKLNRNQ